MRATQDQLTIYEVTPQVITEHLAVYLSQYCQILGDTSVNLNGVVKLRYYARTFDLLCPELFEFLQTAMPVNMTCRKPMCLKFGEISHLSVKRRRLLFDLRLPKSLSG